MKILEDRQKWCNICSYTSTNFYFFVPKAVNKIENKTEMKFKVFNCWYWMIVFYLLSLWVLSFKVFVWEHFLQIWDVQILFKVLFWFWLLQILWKSRSRLIKVIKISLMHLNLPAYRHYQIIGYRLNCFFLTSVEVSLKYKFL